MKILSLISCAAVLGCGIAAMLMWGFTPPAWLAGLEAAMFYGAALLYGYTAWQPSLPAWLWLRPVRGTMLVIAGIVAMYVPPQLILSPYLIGLGVRLVWRSACDLAEKDDSETGVPPAHADRLLIPLRFDGAPQSLPNPLPQGCNRPLHAVGGIRKA
jgi:hypothetical protein